MRSQAIMKFLICVSGLTGAGKTTLSLMLFHFLIDPKNELVFSSLRINNVNLIHQDDYYWPVGHLNHTFLPGTNASDRRAITSLNMDKFFDDLESVPLDIMDNALNIQILEGTHIFIIQQINKICDFRFHLNISYEAALKRRSNTDRWWSNTTEAYFKENSWPTYQSFFKQIPNKHELIYLNGELNVTQNVHKMIDTIKETIITVN